VARLGNRRYRAGVAADFGMQIGSRDFFPDRFVLHQDAKRPSREFVLPAETVALHARMSFYMLETSFCMFE